ncbi:MAG: alpha/beta fold hydrolase [Dehalococcoidia bacterium]|nr:MAG: alpha/beta fold hydrolase [Dehalococcoidia bacterium]
MEPLDQSVLPPGVRSRFVHHVNGATVHILEAGFETPGRPCVVLFHGFPELAYSWRRVLPALAEAGYYAVAPDVRGYGRTSGTDATYDDDIAPYSTLNKVRDALWLVSALGVSSVVAAIGHDAGAAVAAGCALTRPDVFRSVVMMSAPFGGVDRLPFNTATAEVVAPTTPTRAGLDAELARLNPPRKNYRSYYSTREANDNMWHAPGGVHAFLRAYYHHKSADWKQNQPHPLQGAAATEFAKLPRYYTMDLDKGMAETVAAEMPSAAAIEACAWLPDRELAVFAAEYGRTGFQGGLQGYRVGTTGHGAAELSLFAGRTIDVPACFISGAQDWGNYQTPGALERMRDHACTDFRGIHFVEGAGHWVQQEQPERVSALILDFLRGQA